MNEISIDLFDKNNILKNADIIKQFFLNKGEIFIIHNNSNNELSDEEIKDYYLTLNKYIGKVQPVDVCKYTDYYDNDVWVDIKYNKELKSDKPWKSADNLKLHTDNTLTNELNYGNITQLVCLEPSKYSGHTTFISNKEVVNIIRYLDEYEKNNLYKSILNFEIKLSTRNISRKILQVKTDSINNEESSVFNFNYVQAILGDNNDEQKKVIEEFDNFLQNKIMLSNLMTEIKLKRGESIIFNDEKVLHGRRSVIGSRHYIKCSILVPEILITN
jgi:alpha-ketoglutarate-dependent taurine dioxygenase